MPSFFPRLDMRRAKQAEHTAQRLRERFGLLGTPEQVERLAQVALHEGEALPHYKQPGMFRESKCTDPARWVLVRFGKHDIVCCVDDLTAMVTTVAPVPPDEVLRIAKGA